MAYFIDDQIYFQGKQQPPRKVQCHLLHIENGKAYFYDADGDRYTLPEDRIIYDETDKAEK